MPLKIHFTFDGNLKLYIISEVFTLTCCYVMPEANCDSITLLLNF